MSLANELGWQRKKKKSSRKKNCCTLTKASSSPAHILGPWTTCCLWWLITQLVFSAAFVWHVHEYHAADWWSWDGGREWRERMGRVKKGRWGAYPIWNNTCIWIRLLFGLPSEKLVSKDRPSVLLHTNVHIHSTTWIGQLHWTQHFKNIFRCLFAFKGPKVIRQIAAQLFHGQICVIASLHHWQDDKRPRVISSMVYLLGIGWGRLAQ